MVADNKINIKKNSDDEFHITINSKSVTTHLVNVSDEVYQYLTNGKITKEKLLYLSFEFLLNNEPNTSILASFKLMKINDYFPKYVEEIKKRMNY